MSADCWMHRCQPERVREPDSRTPWERDRARIIHSSAFRRLQAKTQVLGIGEGDFHRTRLTHSIEASQIGRGLYIHLKTQSPAGVGSGDLLPDASLLEAICLAHDLGHPPFGHAGERALNHCMREHGGFEGNGQTLRLLSKLESHTLGHGLNLSRRTLLGMLKYPVRFSQVNNPAHPSYKSIAPGREGSFGTQDWKPPKCYLDDEQAGVDWILDPLSPADRERFVSFDAAPGAHGQPRYKSFDASLMELADDIAYGVHDLEDAVALDLVTRDAWEAEVVQALGDRCPRGLDLRWITEALFGPNGSSRKQAVGTLIHTLITAATIQKKHPFESELLAYQVIIEPEAKRLLDCLKRFILSVVFRAEVQTLEYRGIQMILRIFEAIGSAPERMLKEKDRAQYQSAVDSGKVRVICDYIAGMTDGYASKFYQRITMPTYGTVFERL